MLYGMLLYLILLNIERRISNIRLRRRKVNKKEQKLSGKKIFILYLITLTMISVLFLWVIKICIRS